ncbi:glycosyltransferase [Palleronia caenipelagi]|uniref:Glycosyltransferase n=1 Tax=Palleronia caenipelagi TaxID=2489174 RepID=A0A547Q0D3_9RHOB|nr:glycosyltransferase [Palleronia caenipelagi]TRD19835.1 glycosyltransferase [Palleronia caenipelagi]
MPKTILFIHQNFPGQFLHLAPALAARGHRVVALNNKEMEATIWRGVRIQPYKFTQHRSESTHPWLRGMNNAVQRAEAVMRICLSLKNHGLTPDLIVVHSGWGEGLFLRQVWPDTKIAVFSEFMFQVEGADIGFDPEFDSSDEFGRGARVQMRNLNTSLQAQMADALICPTEWQSRTHAPELRAKMTTLFDGIDTKAIHPDRNARLVLPDGKELRAGEEIVTFVNRNLEPYRGFHVFMRALPDLLRRRPNARVIIVGGDSTSYGAAPKQGGTWRELLTKEIQPRMTDDLWARALFVPRLERNDFTRLLQVSGVHVYMTYPFVLSWSMVEAMSAGCTILASDTGPVREFLTHDHTGHLFDFFDQEALVKGVVELLDAPDVRARLGAAAREAAREHYDLRSVCLPQQIAWAEGLLDA